MPEERKHRSTGALMLADMPGINSSPSSCPNPPETPAHDPVNHPSHYTKGRLEVIEVIEDWQLGFHEGNVVKYVARAAHKGSRLTDLKKARWYLDRLIASLERLTDR